MLKEGDEAPAFELQSDAGKSVKLSSYAGKRLVLYFYPKDNTPGCTRESIAFSEAAPRFAAEGVTVLGVSKDSIKSHCSFRDKHGLKIPLLSDPDLTVHKAFGAWGEKMMYGKKVEGTLRSTFIIGPDGKIQKAFPGVKVDGHVEEVLAALAPAKAAAPAKPAEKAKAVAPAKAEKPRAAAPAAKKVAKK